MPGRVGAIDTTREHRDRVPTRCKRGPVGCTLDAVRATGHDDALLPCKITCDFSSNMIPIRGRCTCPGDRHQLDRWPSQERRSTFRPQYERGTGTKIIHTSRPMTVTRNHSINPEQFHLLELFCHGLRRNSRSEPFSPHRAVNPTKDRNGTLGFKEPDRLNCTHSCEEPSSRGIVRLSNH